MDLHYSCQNYIEDYVEEDKDSQKDFWGKISFLELSASVSVSEEQTPVLIDDVVQLHKIVNTELISAASSVNVESCRVQHCNIFLYS